MLLIEIMFERKLLLQTHSKCLCTDASAPDFLTRPFGRRVFLLHTKAGAAWWWPESQRGSAGHQDAATGLFLLTSCTQTCG